MVKKLVTDKKPIIWGYCDQSYLETDTDGESCHPCGGLFASYYQLSFIIMKKLQKYFAIVALIILIIPISSFASFDTNLKLGSRGAAVTDLQNFLISQNYLTGSADGVFGPNTRQAVMTFQTSQRLTPDGSWGPLSRKDATSVVLLNKLSSIAQQAASNSSTTLSGCTSTTGFSITTGQKCDGSTVSPVITTPTNSTAQLNTSTDIQQQTQSNQLSQCESQIPQLQNQLQQLESQVASINSRVAGLPQVEIQTLSQQELAIENGIQIIQQSCTGQQISTTPIQQPLSQGQQSATCSNQGIDTGGINTGGIDYSGIDTGGLSSSAPCFLYR
jgi:peptidoglycan hydrolase-like protein with peptidoglycan-binding domain